MNKKRLIAGSVFFAVVFLILFYFLVIVWNDYFHGGKYFWLWRILTTLEIGALSLGCSIHLLRPNVNRFLFSSKVIMVFSLLVLFFVLEEIPNSPFKDDVRPKFALMKQIIIFLNQVQIAKTIFTFFQIKTKKQLVLYNLFAIIVGGPFFFHYFFNCGLFSLRNDLWGIHDWYFSYGFFGIISAFITVIVLLIRKLKWISK